jgi:hypothetical protein
LSPPADSAVTALPQVAPSSVEARKRMVVWSVSTYRSQRSSFGKRTRATPAPLNVLPRLVQLE